MHLLSSLCHCPADVTVVAIVGSVMDQQSQCDARGPVALREPSVLGELVCETECVPERDRERESMRVMMTAKRARE